MKEIINRAIIIKIIQVEVKFVSSLLINHLIILNFLKHVMIIALNIRGSMEIF